MMIIHSLKYFFLWLLGPHSFGCPPNTRAISSYSFLLFLLTSPTLTSCLSTFILFGISCSLMTLKITYVLETAKFISPANSSPKTWLSNCLHIIPLWKFHSTPISSMESFSNKSIFQCSDQKHHLHFQHLFFLLTDPISISNFWFHLQNISQIC